MIILPFVATDVVCCVAVVILGVETGTEGVKALLTPVLCTVDTVVTAERKSSNSSAEIVSLFEVVEVPTSSSKFIRVVLSRSTGGSEMGNELDYPS